METCELGLGRKIDSIGTCKVNRKGLPKEGILPKNGKGKQPKGTVRCMKKIDKNIFFTGWQDNKPVHMLSTIRPQSGQSCEKLNGNQLL